MIIRFTKAKTQNKSDVLTCIRSDGSTTWMIESAHFIQHDLIHYVVEMNLGFNNAFYGLVANGWDIQEFGRVDPTTGKKPAHPVEAGQVEFIVGLLQAELSDGQTDDNFLNTLETACAGRGVPAPRGITDENLAKVRAKIKDLRTKWEDMLAGESLEFEFNR